MKKNPGNSVKDYVEELGASPTTISYHLKLIGKVKKIDKWAPHKLNKNHKRKRFEISSALLRQNQNYLFLNRIVTCIDKWILCGNSKISVEWLDADKAPSS